MSSNGQAAPIHNPDSPGYVKKFMTFVGAVAALVSSVAAALYIVAPQFQPRNELGATVEKIGVTHAMPYGLYHEEQYGHQDMLDGLVDPKQMGVEVMVNAKLMAYKDRSYFVRAELYEADSMRQLRPAGQESINGACNGKSPKANIDAATWVCWHVSPAAGTKYFVRATLYDTGPSERRVPETLEGAESEDAFISEALNFADSEIFTVPSIEPDDLIYTAPPFEPVDDMPVKPEIPTVAPFKPVDKSS